MRLVLVGVMAGMVFGGGRAKADFTFGTPTNLGPPVNSEHSESGPTISPDGLELYFTSDRPIPGFDAWNLWMATRQTQDDDWSEPVPLGPEINSSTYEDDWPQISPDGLELFFSRYGSGMPLDIWVTKRSLPSEPWGPAVNLGPPINTSIHEYPATITADGLELFFSRETASGLPDIYSSKRATRDEPWGEPQKLGSPVNTSASECFSCISADGLFLCFSSHAAHPDRPGNLGGPDIWVTTRPTRDGPWRTPWNPGPPLNTAYPDSIPSISADGRWLYFSDFLWSGTSVRPGGYGSDDLWKAPIIPIVDFNGDGIVDSADMCSMVDYWGTKEQLCDIGPMPWGDGVVDVEDLKVLAEHLFEQVNDPTLIAHWSLDELEGMFAADSVGDNDAVVLGGIEWQPDGGQIDGALKFDGVSGYAITGGVRNPVDGPFSIIAWVNGGAPGQVVVSQQNASNWLAIDAEGCLMTELKCTGRSAGPLYSETVVTDGQWHRIGLVWDGSNIILYVDGVVVAEDRRDGLQGSESGLNIGAGKMQQPGTYFSGLIDDVRIYNRAVSP
jgi:hypothetical protein